MTWLLSAVVSRQRNRLRYPRHWRSAEPNRRTRESKVLCGATKVRKTTRDRNLVTCERCAARLKLLAGVLS